MVVSYKNSLCKGFGALMTAGTFGYFVFKNMKIEPTFDCYASYDSVEAIPVDAMPG